HGAVRSRRHDRADFDGLYTGSAGRRRGTRWAWRRRTTRSWARCAGSRSTTERSPERRRFRTREYADIPPPPCGHAGTAQGHVPLEELLSGQGTLVRQALLPLQYAPPDDGHLDVSPNRR